MANDPFYSRPLGMPFSENTRRFLAIPATSAAGKTDAIDHAALERLREYVMLDFVCSGIIRTDTLPPRRQSIIELHVAVVCANWAA
jgi:hypothetical protein